MPNRQHQETVQALLEQYGQTFAEEAGIRLEHNTPAPLFQLLCMAMMLSAPIRTNNVVRTVRALREAGLTTPQKMARASWQDRVDVITWHGYKRYDESGSTKLGWNARLLLDRYGGDLRKLRAEAKGDLHTFEERLMGFKGIGKVGTAIFLREVQLVWQEVYPYADERVLRSAQRIGLGKSAKSLAKLVPRADFPRFASALIRVELDKSHRTKHKAA